MQASSSPAPRRTVIAVLVLVLCCLISTGRIFWDAPRPGHSQPAAKERRSEQRFAALKSSLPERGVIGYVGEPGADAMGDYYWAQYALAPLVLDHSTNHPLVVGNFVQTAGTGPGRGNLQLIKDFGDGVQLFANKGAR